MPVHDPGGLPCWSAPCSLQPGCDRKAKPSRIPGARGPWREPQTSSGYPGVPLHRRPPRCRQARRPLTLQRRNRRAAGCPTRHRLHSRRNRVPMASGSTSTRVRGSFRGVRQIRLWQGRQLRALHAEDTALAEGFHAFEPDNGSLDRRQCRAARQPVREPAWRVPHEAGGRHVVSAARGGVGIDGGLDYRRYFG
jgi:hypothetical protein